jgi:hypothetical protein
LGRRQIRESRERNDQFGDNRLMAQAAHAPANNAAGVDPLAVFSGDWQVVNSDAGKVSIDCKTAQSLVVFCID